MRYELPNILDVAREHNLVINPKSKEPEVSCKCPFCKEDSREGKERKFYLSLNVEDQVFKCWFCKESGGVFRFIALLTDQHEQDVIKSWKKQQKGKVKFKPHPVERLGLRQLRLLGYEKRPNWYAMRKRDFEYYRRVRNFIWQEWQAFMQNELRLAYRELLIGIRHFRYQETVKRIQDREKQIGIPLLERVLKIYSLSERPKWAEQEENFLEQVLKKDIHRVKEEQYLYQSFSRLVKEIAECIGTKLNDEEVKRICNLIPELDLDEELNVQILFQIQGMFDKKYAQLTG